MATYALENAQIEEVLIRRVLPGGNQTYERKPYVLIKYDDNQTYLEPRNASPYLSHGVMTHTDAESTGVTANQLIVDTPPYNGIHEFH